MEGLKDFAGNPCAGFGIGESMVMVLQVVAAVGGYGVQLVVWKMWKDAARGAERVVEHVVGIVHLIDSEHCFQASLVERTIVCHERKVLNEWFYLCPHLWKDWCFAGVGTAKTVHSGAPVVVIVWLWLDERVERVCYLAIADDDDANRADRRTAAVGCLEVNCCKVEHVVSMPRGASFPCVPQPH